MTILSKVIDDGHMKKITKEFARLEERCYLENAGSALYPRSLLHLVNKDLLNNVYMNPHTDKYTRDCIEHIRYMIINHFNTDLSKYAVVFTSGTTQSLKLVAESFAFGDRNSKGAKQGAYVYLRDNHTSVLGLREIADYKNAEIVNISHEEFLNVTSRKRVPTSDKRIIKNNALLVYPAQSNFNGYKYPLECIENIKNGCLSEYVKQKDGINWYVMIDAATYVSTNKLDLSKTQPDFVCMSFYKIFGYPTGLGVLLIKKDSVDVLNQKRYFGGGTIDIVLSGENFHVKRKDIQERFEDGTVPFLSILAIKHAFDVLHGMIPKIVNNDLMETISYHTFYLAQDLYKQLDGMHHKNGMKAAMLYMDSDFSDIRNQGGIVTFNIMRDNCSYIGYSEFQHMADLFGISVRTGCFCNSGSCQRHFHATDEDLKSMYNAGHVCGDEIDLVEGRPTGAIRASFAYYNTFEDVDKLVQMICRCFVSTQLTKPLRLHYSCKSVAEVKPHKFANGDLLKFNHDDAILSTNNGTSIKQPKTAITLEEIAIFPIKSCGAFKINSTWLIGSKGLQYDREWMIIKDNGVCLTQKHNIRMCMIRPVIDLRNDTLILNFAGKDPISISLNVPTENRTYGQVCQSKVCTDMVKGYDCGDDVADWISEALEISYLRLIRQSDEDQRVQTTKIGKENVTKQLSLSNQAQFLLINKASVRWLKKKIKNESFNDSIEQLTDRFRGNLIVNSSQELVEKEWQRIIIGKHEFQVEGPCSRCQMVCINQNTGEKTVEPLKTIAEMFAGKLRFGIYLSYVGPVNGYENTSTFLEINSAIVTITNDYVSRGKNWLGKLSSCKKRIRTRKIIQKNYYGYRYYNINSYRFL